MAQAETHAIIYLSDVEQAETHKQIKHRFHHSRKRLKM
jgi:hypothetical protein